MFEDDDQPGLSGSLNPDQLFARMQRQNSNLELDWLWLSSLVRRPEQRAYCLDRAREINPESLLVELLEHPLPPTPVPARGRRPTAPSSGTV